MPALYCVTTTIVNAKNGDILDEVSNKVGFRWFSFDSGKGFSLNDDDLWNLHFTAVIQCHDWSLYLLDDMGTEE